MPTYKTKEKIKERRRKERGDRGKDNVMGTTTVKEQS